MAVVDKCADSIWIAEVHTEAHAGVGWAFPIPEWNVDCVTQKRLVYRDAKKFLEKEMKLMNVEGVQFLGAILNDPVLDVSLMHDDIRGEVVGIERLRRLAVDGDHENRGTLRIIRIGRLLRKIK